MDNSKEPTKTHLVVASHGIFGVPTTANQLSSLLTQRYPDILFHSLQSNWGYFFSFASTTDGIMPGGDRILKEINDICDANPQLKKISFIGISLGGIYLRYVIGKMYQETNFRGLMPYSYISFASPHVGIADYPNYIQQLIISALGRTTTSQLLLRDDLMLELSDPDGIYLKGLRRFVKRTAYSNYLYDSKVSYVSGAILPLEFDYYKYSDIMTQWKREAGKRCHILSDDEVLYERHTEHLQPYNFTDKATVFLEPMIDPKRYPHILMVEYYEHWHYLINAFPIIKDYIAKHHSTDEILIYDDNDDNDTNPKDTMMDIDHIVGDMHVVLDVIQEEDHEWGMQTSPRSPRLSTNEINKLEEMEGIPPKNNDKNSENSDEQINENILISNSDRESTIVEQQTYMESFGGLVRTTINGLANIPIPTMADIGSSIRNIPGKTTSIVGSIPEIASSVVTVPYTMTSNMISSLWSKSGEEIEMQRFGSSTNTIESDVLYEKQLKIIKNMRQLSWTHVTVLFKENFSSYTAHNSINVSGLWFSLGTDVVDHCVDTFDKKTK